MTTLKTAVPNVTITQTGLSVPDLSDVLAGRLTDIDASMGGGGNKSLTSPSGQIALSDTAIIAEVRDALLCFFNQINPDYSTGRFQDGIGRIYFMNRIPGAGTIVTTECVGLVGTVIPKGSRARDTKGNIYQSINSATIGQSGRITVEFQCVKNGSIPCGVGELNTILTPISGWDTIYNNVSGVMGNDEENRTSFETRRKLSVAKNSQNLDQSLRAEILSVKGVADCYVWSNRTSLTVNTGATNYPVKPHSVYICVYGGTDDDIAQAIINKKGQGSDMNGSNAYVYEFKEGNEPPYPSYTLDWETAIPTQVYFKVEIKNSPSLPNDLVSRVRGNIISTFTGNDGVNGKARIGSYVTIGRYFPSVINVDPVNVNVVSIQVSLDNTNWASEVLLGIDQIPVLQASDISVVLV